MTAFTRRHVLRAGSLLGAGALLPSWASAQAADPLRVWRYKGTIAYFLEQAGLATPPYPLEWVDIAGGNLVLEALTSNSLDYAFMSEIPPIFASIANAPLALIASYSGDNNKTGIVVKRNSGIAQIGDLRGKRISYVRATNTHYLLLNILRRNGMTLADVQAIPLPAQDGLTAFQNGHIDALVTGGISAIHAEANLDGVLMQSAEGYYSGNYLIATTHAVLAQPGKRAAIADFLLREKSAWDWIEQHPEQWAARSEQLTKIPKALYLQQFEQRSQPARLKAVDEAAIVAQQEVADVFHESGLIRRKVDVRPLWDAQFTELLGG
ncbi:putative aliphatic sulfonates-binding protein [Pseudomonas reidholzensis]|uniref:Putative aliphatic sulfonates-binding protein n=1 Tax=Pseudomonas reidholzensis TaxID=1785162 RepID=A0A383RYJ4_9PSED|nr:ABC transporter substrate-binding protein [Pseudomonas reidholzensis]SYX91965.1 putative aliphatic sulfonates-binding protein [Pseudomonas reidholzensis]